MVFFRGSGPAQQQHSASSEKTAIASSDDVASEHVLSEGTLKYTLEQGGNGSLPSYQEASGAPVEANSSLGYAAGPVTIVLLNVGKMVGTGVYSTRMFVALPLFGNKD